MSGLNPEYHDREILEHVAEEEAERRPFEYTSAGIGYEALVDDFDYEDFDHHPMFMLPNRLKQLSENGYLEQVSQNRSSTNAAYRLTDHGWDIVDVVEPDGPVEVMGSQD